MRSDRFGGRAHHPVVVDPTVLDQLHEQVCRRERQLVERFRALMLAELHSRGFGERDNDPLG